MNKIFKVIYSKTKHMYVVASELAKSHSKSKNEGAPSGKALAALVMAALASASFMAAPMTAQAKTETEGWEYIGIRHDSDESSANYKGAGSMGNNSITIGKNAKAGDGTITIGDRRADVSKASVYVGQGDIAKPKNDTGAWVTSVGYNSDATGYGSIAIGSNAVAKNSYDKDASGNNIQYSKTYTDTNGKPQIILNADPGIQRASVALGYGASADNGNIAIGSYSDASTDLRTAKTKDGKEIKSYLTDKMADSYVSVGDGKDHSETQYRRISNVADGASASDVATVGQLQALSAKVGVYDAGFGIVIDSDKDNKKNTISLNRNLGTNLDKTGHVYLDVSDTGLVLGTVVDGASGTDMDLHYGATGDYAVTVGGGANTASGKASVVLGGSLNKASNEATVASGGSSNVASGSMAAVYGGFDNEASEAYATILGGAQNKASNTWTAVGGGALNEASGKYASVWGGYHNKATDDSAAVYGGLGNSAYGSYSAILGGGSNKAGGGAAVVSGGASNEAAGIESAVLGGVGNIVTGANATAVGGFKGSVNGVDSVGILGGSTGINAPLTLAAGYQSTVTDTGVTSTPITEEEAEKFQEEGTHPGLIVGSNDPDNLSFKILDHFATAVGYQATADEAQTVAFGHDKGDTYYGTTTYTWKQKATVKDGHYYDEYNQEISKESYESLKNADGTWNDYSQPIATVEEKKYDSAYYNRLVKAADGIEDHDAVVMEQLKNASDVGSNIKVYQMDENGNIKFDKNNNPIEDTSDSDAVKTKREAAQKASEDAWGKAIGTGKIADPTKSDTNDPEANGSQQLVTGGTVYDALQKQKTELTDSLSVNAGWGIDIDKAKKNTISVKHNLGTGYADTDATGLILGGSLQNRDAAKEYGTATASSVIVGAQNALASNDNSVVVGGLDNVASGANSTVVGGDNNKASGNQSAVFGGRDNTASGIASTAGGGIMNVANGWESTAIGGFSNYALGTGSTSVGGYGKDYATGHNSSVNGNYSVGIAGGSTGKDANYSLAAGRQAVVTTENGTAIGYQATTDEANTIAFGHDAGDVSGYTIEWEQLPNGQVNADGTSNDYTKAPTVTENKYESAAYNRLVKAADGVENHDAVVMEQLKNASNVGQNIKVYKTDENGNVQFDESNNPIEDKSDAVKAQREAAQKASEDAWGTAIGTGKIADPNVADKETNGSQQLVTGGTVYNEVRPADGTYVKKNKTTAENLTALDKQMSDMDGSAVKYDTTTVDGKTTVDKTKITLAGGTTGTTITNVKSALNGATDISKVTEGLTNAVNLSDLQTAYNALDKKASGAHTALTVEGKTVAATEAGKYAGKNIQLHSDTDANGKVTYDVKLAKDLTGITSISGGTDDNGAKITLDEKDKNISVNNGKITNLTAGEADDDAATVKQVNDKVSAITYTAGNGIVMDKDAKTISAKAGKGITVDAGGINVNVGNHLSVGTDGKVNVGDNGEVAEKDTNLVTGGTVYDALHGGLDNIVIGKPGKDGAAGTPGTIGLVGPAGTNGKDGMVAIKIQKGTDDADKGIKGANGVDGKDGITRIVYTDAAGDHQAATVEDGLKFAGDDGQTATDKVIAKKLNNTIDIIGGADSTKLTDKNIGVNNVGGQLKVQLAKDLTGISSISGGTDDNGAKITLDEKDKNISVNNGKITNLTAGEADDDAATVKQVNDKVSAITYTAGNGIVMDKDAKTISAKAGKGITVDAGGINVNVGNHLSVGTDGKVNVGDNGEVAEKDTNLVTGGTVYDALHGGLDNIVIGKPGKDGAAGTPGTIGLVGPAGTNGKDGMVAIKIQKGTDDADKGIKGANGVDGKNGITRIVYTDAAGDHQAATMEDGLKFAGDDGQKDASKVIAKKLNNTVDIIGGATGTLTEGNIGVNNENGKLKVQLAKDLMGIASISNQTTSGTTATGAKIELSTDGKTTISGGDVSVSNNKVTNLKDGDLSDKSTDAVTGKQLYQEQQNRIKAIGTLSKDKYNYIDKTASVSDNLDKLDTQVKTNADAIDGLKTRVDTLDGDAVKYDKDSSKGKITLEGKDGTTITNLKDGSIAENGKDAVNGGQLYTEQEARKAEDQKINDKIGTLNKDTYNYIDKAASVSDNLDKLDTQAKTNADAISKETQDRKDAIAAVDKKIGSLDKDGNYIKKDDSISKNLSTLDGQVKTNADNIANNTKAISEIKTTVNDLSDNAVQYDKDSNKSKVTLAGKDGTTIANVKDGSVAKDSKDAVNGGQLFDEQTARENADKEIRTDITNIKDGEGFTDKGKTVIKSLAQDAVDVVGGDNVTVTSETQNDKKTFTVKVDGNGKVASGDKGLISGDTIYNELRPTSDGSYIRTDQTTARNLTNLDTQVKKNSDLINSDGSTIKIGSKDAATKIDVSDKDGNGRTITGVVTDGSDTSSAANVGYVNDVAAANTQQIYREMHSAYGHLNNNINKAAAGSNALAALHPLDYDPADKASYAVGYGHYRNANAAAVGAFYQPNANTMVSVGVSMGNGDPGVNAGVSFKVGKGSAYNGMSKVEMAETIQSQAQKIDNLEKENQEMKKQIQEILAKLGK